MMDLRSMQMLHDLKMPIQLIYSCVQLLEMEVGRSARAQDYLRMLTQSAGQMEAMVRMAFADESSSGDRCDAVAIARSARDRAALIAPALELRFQTNAAEFPLNANGELITRVLDNLLENAIRFTPAGGRIRVEVKALGDSVELSVIDGGPGMDAAYQSHIFEPGVSRGGTGYGLSSVRDCARALGGTITVDSAPGRGSRFTLRVPAHGSRSSVSDRRLLKLQSS